MKQVGVRELRQNASTILDGVVASGQGVEVTNHGRPVARLLPISTTPRHSTDDLIQTGALRPGRGNVLDVLPLNPTPGAPSTADLLDEARSER